MLINEIKFNEKLTPAMKQYVDLKEIHSNSLLFFRMGDFYELFFDDAILASKELNITLTRRGKVGEKEIPMCGIPYHAVDNYLPRLIKNGFSVAICEQTETPENMKVKGLSGPLKREVVRVITPGTLLEEHLLESKNYNFLGAIITEEFNFSISWLDVSTGIFLTNQFHSSNHTELIYKIENTLSKLTLSELLISDDFDEDLIPLQYKKITKKLEKKVFVYEKNYIKLKQAFPEKKENFFKQFLDMQIVTSGVLLNYLTSTFLNNLPKLMELKSEKYSSFMELDNVTIKSLEIIEKSSGEKKGSLIDVIDKTLTPMAGRLLRKRIISPSCDLEEIEKRLNLAEFFIKNKDKNHILKTFFSQFADVERALSRISFHKSNPADLLTVAKSLLISEKIKKEIIALKANKNSPIFLLLKKIKFNMEITKEIIKAFKNDLQNLKDENFINDGFSKDLDKLKLIKKYSSQKILSLQNEYVKFTSINSLKIKFNKVLGYHIEVRAIHIEKMNNLNQFIHRQTTAQASRYTTNQLLNLEKDIYDSDLKIKEKELEIFEKIKSRLLKERLLILNTSDSISKLDIALMTADQSINKNYVRPVLSENKKFLIEEGRHPVIENLINFNTNDFVPNNCNLNESIIWLITGPNMAGKSTFLRQNALIAILAQTGLFVPAKKVHIGIIDKIFSRVGASDDISKGHSTFMVEMLETASILKRASDKSFIIFDEIGRGTSTFDGLAIAWAVLEFLIKDLKSRVLFATHYHELTNLKKNYKQITNYKMYIKEWEDSIVFLYKVIKGEADKSYGIEVAKLAGFPKSLISNANNILSQLEKTSKLDIKKNNSNYIQHQSKEMTNLEKFVNEIDPNKTSPLEALNLIFKLKEKLNKPNLK